MRAVSSGIGLMVSERSMIILLVDIVGDIGVPEDSLTTPL